jgi:hypothetical protein
MSLEMAPNMDSGPKKENNFEGMKGDYNFGDNPEIDELPVMEKIKEYHPDLEGMEGMEIEGNKGTAVYGRLRGSDEITKFQINDKGEFVETLLDERRNPQHILVDGKLTFENSFGSQEEMWEE